MDFVMFVVMWCFFVIVLDGMEVKLIVRCDYLSYNEILINVILLFCLKFKVKFICILIIKVKIYFYNVIIV